MVKFGMYVLEVLKFSPETDLGGGAIAAMAPPMGLALGVGAWMPSE